MIEICPKISTLLSSCQPCWVGRPPQTFPQMGRPYLKGLLMLQLSWIYLILAGFFEVGFTTFLKMSVGFTRALPTFGFIACLCSSFWLFNKAITQIPLGTAYAIFTGIGVLGTVLVQVFVFGSSLSPAKMFFMLLLMSSIIGLKVMP